MGLSIRCDGCDCEVPPDTKPVGWVEQVYYCHDCHAHWDAAEAKLQAKEVELAEVWAAHRLACLAEAKAHLKKCPDE